MLTSGSWAERWGSTRSSESGVGGGGVLVVACARSRWPLTVACLHNFRMDRYHGVFAGQTTNRPWRMRRECSTTLSGVVGVSGAVWGGFAGAWGMFAGRGAGCVCVYVCMCVCGYDDACHGYWLLASRPHDDMPGRRDLSFLFSPCLHRLALWMIPALL